ncbi:hypothetical protein B0J14DRAFT_569595 [Halenospora varia]|nr:hypothetical protein B0J14DRAFT_569595 [Halenospora varia]
MAYIIKPSNFYFEPLSFSSFLVLIASASCLLINSWDDAPSVRIPSIQSDLTGFLELQKRLGNYDQYAAQNPRNRIPAFLTVNRQDNGMESARYTRDEIWRAMDAGLTVFRQWEPTQHTPNEFPRPRFRTNFFPHPFYAMEENLRDQNTGDGDRREMYEWPLRHGTFAQPAIYGTGHPGPDRMIFDRTGRYMGVVTHRGEFASQFHWGSPTNANSAALGPEAIELEGIPGTPVHTTFNGPQAARLGVIDQGGIDAVQPAKLAWGKFNKDGGGLKFI